MGERYSRQESMELKKRLLRVNTKRVLYVSACTAIILPIILLIYKLVGIDEEMSSVITSLLLGYEAVTLVNCFVIFAAARSKNRKLKNLIVKSFWAEFLAFSFVMMYFDAMAGGGLVFQGIMLAVLAFIPIMATTEIMYYFVVQALFTVFLMVKFNMGAKSIADIVLMNLIFFAISRVAYNVQLEGFRMKERSKDMKKGMSVDPLTGLMNRKGLQKQAAAEVLPAIRSHKRIGVLMIDIDYLGAFNSEYGMERGDALIRSVADTIRKVSIRTTDVVCRLNGGRFMILMTGGTDMEAVQLASKIRGTIEKQRIQLRYGRTNGYVTVSVGVASGVVRSESGYLDLCEEAENSMHQAKNQGRNVIVFDEQVYRSRNRAAI